MQKEHSLQSTVDDSPASSPAEESRRSSPKAARRIASEDIFAGAVEVEIDHNGTLYRLRRTSMGKLILTK